MLGILIVGLLNIETLEAAKTVIVTGKMFRKYVA